MFCLLRGLEEWTVLLVGLSGDTNALHADFNCKTTKFVSLEVRNSSICKYELGVTNFTRCTFYFPTSLPPPSYPQ